VHLRLQRRLHGRHSDEIDGISKFHRFFTYLSLFCFSMLLLVIADSLLLLFIAWELVGICSYLLIGYYFHKKSASNAAIKAFVTNRVGDFGFIIGLGMVFYFLGDMSLAGAAKAFRTAYDTQGPLFTQSLLGMSLATWMGMLLFCGAIARAPSSRCTCGCRTRWKAPHRSAPSFTPPRWSPRAYT